MKGGGSLESVGLNGRNFSVAADSDPGRALGGKKNSIEMNGDGTFRIVQENTPSKFGGIAIQVDDDNEDQEYIQDLVDAGVSIDGSVTYNDGTTYSGPMAITEDVEYSPKPGTMEITLEGGRLRKQ